MRKLIAAFLLLAGPASATTYAVGAGSDSGEISAIANGNLSYVSDQPVEIQVKNTASGATATWSKLISTGFSNDNKTLVSTGTVIKIVNRGLVTANVDLNIASSGSGPSYGTAGSPNNAVGTVQGITNGTPVPVTISGGGGTTPTGSAGSPNAAVVTVQGIASGTVIPVSGTTVPVGTAGSPTASVQSVQGVSGGTAIPVSGTTVPTGTSGTPSTSVISVQGVAGGTAQPVSGTVSVSGTVTTAGTTTATISGIPSFNLFSSSITLPVSGPAGAAVVVDGSAVAQPTIGYAINPSGSFTRPANTTAYAANYLVANSTTAGSVTPISLTAGRVSGGSFMIRRVGLRKTGTSTTNAGFRVHLFRAAPTVANGDGATNSMTGAANYLGAFDVTMNQIFTDGATGFGGPNSGQDVTIKLASGTTIYALVEALGAYSPVSGETFTLTLEDLQN